MDKQEQTVHKSEEIDKGDRQKVKLADRQTHIQNSKNMKNNMQISIVKNEKNFSDWVSEWLNDKQVYIIS